MTVAEKWRNTLNDVAETRRNSGGTRLSGAPDSPPPPLQAGGLVGVTDAVSAIPPTHIESGGSGGNSGAVQ